MPRTIWLVLTRRLLIVFLDISESEAAPRPAVLLPALLQTFLA